MTENIQSFSSLLRQTLGDRIDADASSFVEMMAEDGVMEFPYSPAGLPTRLEGRAVIATHLMGLSEIIAFDRMGAAVVHPSTDPNVVIIEFEGFGRGVATGEPYDQRYVSVIRTAGVSCPLLSGPSTMTVWIKEGTTNACQEAQARGDHREAA